MPACGHSGVTGSHRKVSSKAVKWFVFSTFSLATVLS